MYAEESRAYTPDECRAQLLDYLRTMVRYCAHELPVDWDCEQRLDQLVFAILNVFDGTTADLPAFELRPAPHPDDEAFLREEGENWWPTDVDLADSLRHLHEMWVKKDWPS